MFLIWLLLFLPPAFSQKPSSSALLSRCDDPEAVIAMVPAADPIQVHYGLGGGANTCYSVSVLMNGKRVDGYMLGTAHPGIIAFEQGIRSSRTQVLLPVTPEQPGSPPKQPGPPKEEKA